MTNSNYIFCESLPLFFKAVLCICVSKALITHSLLEKNAFWGWRHDSVVKITYCSCREFMFHSQYPHWTAQPPIALAPENLTL